MVRGSGTNRDPPAGRLTDAFAQQLQQRFGCPVLDVYALTEAGIVAMKTPAGHVVLPHDLYVEILDENDEVCPPGVRGEITLTGGRNPFAPLLRYRTGDFASLQWHDGRPHLVALEGRGPVSYVATDGRIIHSMEVARCLRPFPLVQYKLEQRADSSFCFGYRGNIDRDAARGELLDLLGHAASFEINELPPNG